MEVSKIESMASPGEPTHSFPWRSDNVVQIKNIFRKQSDWKLTLSGADEIEREVLADVLANGGPFVKFDCRTLEGKSFQKEIFGTFKFTKKGQKILVSSIADQVRDGVLLLEHFDQLPIESQIILPSIIDTKLGRRCGDYTYDEVPIRFKMISALDSRLPRNFEPRLRSRLGIGFKIEPLSERPEDLVPVLKYFFKRMAFVRDDLWISDSFWKKLDSRSWPLSLGQWVECICTFFSKNVSRELTWAGFLGSLDVDFEGVMSKHDRITKLYEMQKRSILLERILQAKCKEDLLKSLAVSWERLVGELNRLGLSDDADLCRKLVTLPWYLAAK